MKRRAHLLWTAAALAGCVSTTHESAPGPVQPLSHVPDPDAPGRTVGMLRRLVVLPAAIEFTPEDPRDCFETCNPQALLRGLADEVPRVLRAQRGYETTSLDPLHAADADASETASTPALAAGQLREWHAALLRHARTEHAAAPPVETAQAARALAAATRADGIVLLHGTMIWDRTTDWLLGYLTFSLSLGVMFARWGLRLQADILEGASGRIVWRGRYSERSGIVGQGGTEPIVRALFDSLEPALPRLFTTPR